MKSIPQTSRDLFKTLVKSTPIIADTYLYLKFPYTANLYKGTYDTFQEAQSAIPPKFNADYNLLDAHQKPRSDLNIFRPINYPLLNPLTAALAEVSTILDLGGGIGTDYYGFQQILNFPDTLKWIVYEVPAAVKVGQILAAKNQCPNLQFTSDLLKVNIADLLLTNGALQYLEPSLTELLAQFSQKPKYLFINYVPCYEGKTYFTIQNLEFARCPYKIQNRSELISGLEELGYQLVESWKHPRTCFIPFHPDHFVENYLGFYFKQRD